MPRPPRTDQLPESSQSRTATELSREQSGLSSGASPGKSPGKSPSLDEILSLDGKGSITVTPCAPPIDTQDVSAPGPSGDSHNATGDQRADNGETAGGSNDETAGEEQGTLSPNERLKAALSRQKQSAGGIGAAQADRQFGSARDTAMLDAAAMGDIADMGGDPSQPASMSNQLAGGPPAVRRIVEPTKVEYTAPALEPGHVKLSDLPAKTAQPETAPHVVPKSTDISDGGAAAANTEPFRHLPDGVRGKLEAFTSAGADAPSGVGASADAGPISPIPPAPITAPSVSQLNGGGELKAAILASRKSFMAAGLFSLVINLLMLAGPLFMLQVYDRVMTSGSIPTLVVLFAMTVGLFCVMGLLELARSRIIVRVGVEVDKRISDRIFQAVLRRSLSAPDSMKNMMREHDQLRSFLAGPGPMTFFDAPWTPAYLLIIFALHWVLGLAATIGGFILVTLALISEFRSRAPLSEASRTAAVSLDLSDTGQRNTEALTAMGMMGAYRARWQEANAQTLSWQVLVADRLGSISALSKSLRLLMQSTMLAIGAVLALQNEISAGTIVAASIIFGRALAPVEQAIGQWRPFTRARDAYFRLSDLLESVPAPRNRTKLPAPKGQLSVENLRVAAPDTRQLILANINFAIGAGEVLAVVGPSASGKSTLARTLVGLWPPFGGSIRIDGSRLDQWDPEDLGQHIGYLPQSVELFSGTVRENIARFRTDASDEEVIEAASRAHAHELILALPRGYDTQLGSFGAYLSGGQRQRLGLARALFGNPAFVVLDEPNANLDRQGDEALDGAIEGMRERGQSVVLISHRVGAVSKADKLLYIDRGMQRAFGPREEVMSMIRGAGAGPSRRADDRVDTAGKRPARATRSSEGARSSDGSRAANRQAKTRQASDAGEAGRLAPHE